jgi:hypothetical protein
LAQKIKERTARKKDSQRGTKECDTQDRTGRKRLPGQGCFYKATRTRLLGLGCYYRTARTGLSQHGTALQGRIERRGQPEKNSYNPTARTTPRMRQPDRDNQTGTAR